MFLHFVNRLLTILVPFVYCFIAKRPEKVGVEFGFKFRTYVINKLWHDGEPLTQE